MTTQHSRRDTQDSKRIIRASELGQYVYCPKAWWLGGVLGVKSTNTQALQHGVSVHQAHGRQIVFSRVLLIAAAAVFVLALFVLIFTTR